MNLRQRKNCGALLIAILILSGCATRTGPVISPTIPQTSLQWTIVLNASLAKSNRAVEQTAETLHKNNLLTTDQTRPVIIVCGKVAAISENIRAITSAGTEASWQVDGPRIRHLLAASNLNFPVDLHPTVDLVISTVKAALTLLTAETAEVN